MTDFLIKRIAPLFRIDKSNWWKFLLIWVCFILLLYVHSYKASYGYPDPDYTVFHFLFLMLILLLISIILAFWFRSLIPLIIYFLSIFSTFLIIAVFPGHKIINNIRIAFTDKTELPAEGEYIKWGEDTSWYTHYSVFHLLKTKEIDRDKILTVYYGRTPSIPLDPKRELLRIYRISDDYVIINYSQY